MDIRVEAARTITDVAIELAKTRALRVSTHVTDGGDDHVIATVLHLDGDVLTSIPRPLLTRTDALARHAAGVGELRLLFQRGTLRLERVIRGLLVLVLVLCALGLNGRDVIARATANMWYLLAVLAYGALAALALRGARRLALRLFVWYVHRALARA